MLEQIDQIIKVIDGAVWGLPLIILILFTGFLLTTRLGLLQIRHLGKALKFMFKNEEDGQGEVTSFGALCTALSATIGTGMEKCLTCHKTQNDISTVDDMRAFLKQNQEAQAKRQNEVDAKLSVLYDGILAAVNNGGVDADDLEAAKDKYSLANWYVKEQQGNLFDPVDGAQIAHNPEVLRQCLERADALIDEGMELLA